MAQFRAEFGNWSAVRDVALLGVVQLALAANCENADDIEVREESVEGDIAALTERNHELANLSLDAPADERVRRKGGDGRLDGGGRI